MTINSTINVRKSNGTLEPLNLGKILRWASWATQGSPNISLESLLTVSSASFYDGVSTNDITLAICKNCEDLSHIAAKERNFAEVQEYFNIARNLYIPNILKKANNNLKQFLLEEDKTLLTDHFEISEGNIIPLDRYPLKTLLKTGIHLGIYDSDLLDGSLSDELFQYADEILDYRKMNLLYFGGLRQMEEKYLTKYNGNIFEDPQQHFMLIALTLVHSDARTYKNGSDLNFQKDALLNYYRVQSEDETNSPTPFSNGLRTPFKSYDSCLLFEIDDENNSIDAGMMTAQKATVAGAGVGVSMGRIRAKGKTFRKSGIHAGLLGYLGQLSKTIKASNQISRGGSATVNFPIWHRDYYELVMLKDTSGGIEGENRYRHLDYAFHYSEYLVNKLKTNGKILLVSPNEVLPNGKTVYDAFYNLSEDGVNYDDSEFVEYCESKLNNPDIVLEYVSNLNSTASKSGEMVYTTAYDLFSTFISQAFSTGRLYTLNINNVNNHSSFLDVVTMSNLCMEITEPTVPVGIHYDSKTNTFTPREDSEAAFCQLGGIVLGQITKEDLKRVCYWTLRIQEAVFNISDYSRITFSHKQKKRRSIGIGLVNLHHMLVKEVFSKYPEKEWVYQVSKSTHEWMEAIKYWILDASIELAKELGTPELFNRSTYSRNILPIDTWKDNDLTSHPLLMDWKGLRLKGTKYGYRFSTHDAFMPVESSSVRFGKINGNEPPRAPVTNKGNKKLTVAVAVPDIVEYGQHYFYAWDKRSVNINDIILASSTNIQKFGDQSLSLNWYYDVADGVKVSEEEAINRLFIIPIKYGLKTSYYINFNRDSDEEESQDIKTNLTEEMTEEEKEFYEQLKELEMSSGCAGGSCTL